LIAAVMHQYDLTLLTADNDFSSVAHFIAVENWLT
jgi:predicted nucleic acid-binding protein